MADDRRQWLARMPREDVSRRMGIAAWIITGAVFILVGLMRQPELHVHLAEGISLSFLPAFHAVVNAVTAVVLLCALAAVLTGRIALHRGFILVAMGLSVIFLLSYVAYHFTSVEIKYGDANFDGILDAKERLAVAGSRTDYLFLLISHIVLAGVSLPFILFTFIAGWTNRFATHRRLARLVFPIWLYVAITGPICYWMMRPYYH